MNSSSFDPCNGILRHVKSARFIEMTKSSSETLEVFSLWVILGITLSAVIVIVVIIIIIVSVVHHKQKKAKNTNVVVADHGLFMNNIHLIQLPNQNRMCQSYKHLKNKLSLNQLFQQN